MVANAALALIIIPIGFSLLIIFVRITVPFD